MLRIRKAHRRRAVWLVLGLFVLPLCGCASHPQYGDKKEDWAKTKPPKNWRGPGQPGGPPTGAASAPGGPPAAAQPAGR